jgi:hypothetical protein
VKARSQRDQKIAGILGVGLDAHHGHTRITEGEDLLLVGGSQETHERMQETMVKINEALDRKGKRLRDASVGESVDLIRDAHR